MTGQNLGKYAAYISTFTFSGAMGILKYWHENRQELSEEDIVTLLVALMTKGAWNITD